MPLHFFQSSGHKTVYNKHIYYYYYYSSFIWHTVPCFMDKVIPSDHTRRKDVMQYARTSYYNMCIYHVMINLMQVNDADQLGPSVYEQTCWNVLLFCTCIKAINTANVFKRIKSLNVKTFTLGCILLRYQGFSLSLRSF